MYYPKSQIKSNLYTKGGEFTQSQNGTPYKGFYYKTSTGKFFSGKTPNDSPSFRLYPVPQSNPTPDSISNNSSQLVTPTLQTLEENQKGFWTSNFVGYNPNIDKTRTYNTPKQTYPTPTEQNYEDGEFVRYFLKKSNEPKFLEISKIDYNKFESKDSSVPYELYTPIKIDWVLTGTKTQVYEVNKRTVERTEFQQSLPGFSQYFKGEFTKFYK